MRKRKFERVSLEMYFKGERFQSPYIGKQSIPWPFTRFGKSIDAILREKEFDVNDVEFSFEEQYGDLCRFYSNQKNRIKVEYAHSVKFSEDKFQNYKGPSFEEGEVDLKRIKNLEVRPEKFFELYCNEKIGSDLISINCGESNLGFYRIGENLFSIDGRAYSQDLHKLFPQASMMNRDGFYGEIVIDPTYLSEQETLNYFVDVISNLIK
jgi:hypothetical protein